MRAKELYEYIDLYQENQGGTIEGYEVEASAEQLPNWLANEIDNWQELTDKIRSQTDTIAIAKNMYVDEEMRGQGHGSELFDTFMGSTEAPIILLADTLDTQQSGFDLVSFYEERGFVSIQDTSSGPLMVYPEEFAAKLV